MKKVKTYLMMALFGIILMGAFNTKASAARRFQMTRYEGHVYIRIDKNMKWTTADRLARSCGGHLVTITSKEENDFVVDLAKDRSGSLWAGGKTFDAKTWYWINSEPFDYQNWDTGEPNNFDNAQDTLQIYVSGKWEGYSWVGWKKLDYFF